MTSTHIHKRNLAFSTLDKILQGSNDTWTPARSSSPHVAMTAMPLGRKRARVLHHQTQPASSDPKGGLVRMHRVQTCQHKS